MWNLLEKLAPILTAIRWGVATALPLVLWNFHHEIMAWGNIYVMAIFATLGVTSVTTQDFPTMMSDYGLWPYYAAVNDWIPLSEWFVFVVAYCGLYLIYMPIKVVLRHLPLIGG